MMNQVCPITVAMQKLGGESDKMDNVVIFGGTEIICNNSEYIITLDTIEVARFEAKNARRAILTDHGDRGENDNDREFSDMIDEFAKTRFSNIMGLDYTAAYQALFSSVLIYSDLFVHELERLSCLVDAIELAHLSTHIAELVILPDIHFVATRRVDVLQTQLKLIDNFMRGLKIRDNNSNGDYYHADLVYVPDIIIPQFPDNNKTILSQITSFDELREVLADKVEILNYMQKIEHIHCLATNYIAACISALMVLIK